MQDDEEIRKEDLQMREDKNFASLLWCVGFCNIKKKTACSQKLLGWVKEKQDWQRPISRNLHVCCSFKNGFDFKPEIKVKNFFVHQIKG